MNRNKWINGDKSRDWGKDECGLTIMVTFSNKTYRFRCQEKQGHEGYCRNDSYDSLITGNPKADVRFDPIGRAQARAKREILPDGEDAALFHLIRYAEELQKTQPHDRDIPGGKNE